MYNISCLSDALPTLFGVIKGCFIKLLVRFPGKQSGGWSATLGGRGLVWLTASCVPPQARLNCKHCGKPVIDVRIGMQYFSEYSNVQQCPHCGNLDYHFVKPFSSFKVLEAYWWKLCFSNSYFIDITLLHIFSREAFCDIRFFSDWKESSFVYACHFQGACPLPSLDSHVLVCGHDQSPARYSCELGGAVH